jgi:hypothetical protein
MGWWTVDSSRGELYVGDEPLDFVGDLLKNLARVYVEDLGRRPKLDEVCKLLELGLSTADDYLSGAGNIEVAAIQARTKKRRKRQPFEMEGFPWQAHSGRRVPDTKVQTRREYSWLSLVCLARRL